LDSCLLPVYYLVLFYRALLESIVSMEPLLFGLLRIQGQLRLDVDAAVLYL